MLRRLVGSGDRIGLLVLPFLVGGVIVNLAFPAFFSVGGPGPFLREVSIVMLGIGIVVWAWSVILILIHVPRGELITGGPFAVVKHPLYTSVALLVLPWLGFLLNTWLGMVLGIVLYVATRQFAPEEEAELATTFRDSWEAYRREGPGALGVMALKTSMIPAAFRDLVECPPVAALSTILPSGYPMTSVVWCDYDGALVRVNTMRGFAKERNMRRNPLVTLLCFDPLEPLRSLEIRGTVGEMTEVGAQEHLDALASKYIGGPVRYFGDVIPAHFVETETPVLCRIQPTHVVPLDARVPEMRQ